MKMMALLLEHFGGNIKTLEMECLVNFENCEKGSRLTETL